MTTLPEPVSGVENVPAGEAEQIQEISELMVKLMEQRYREPSPFLRGVHPKAHGCAKATFTVNSDLSEDLRVGVFANVGKSFEAVVRFSNAAALVGPDVVQAVKDGVKSTQHGSRGMALKVRGLPGVSLAGDEPNTQDFLMVNFAVFPFANVADYLALTRAQLENEDKLPLVFKSFREQLVSSGGAVRAGAAGAISGKIQQTPMINPLSSQYFSAAPFLFGQDRVMKYSVKPVPVSPDTAFPETVDENYLRTGLAQRLREADAVFDFAVQVRTPSKEANIEDVTAEWTEADIPFRSVAKVVLPKQEIDSPDLQGQCESLFWTPWHAMPEHRPVGGINRLRFAVYQASANRRRK